MRIYDRSHVLALTAAVALCTVCPLGPVQSPDFTRTALAAPPVGPEWPEDWLGCGCYRLAPTDEPYRQDMTRAQADALPDVIWNPWSLCAEDPTCGLGSGD